jgi:spore germination cell wall hydrolase CwlJ-like protein
VGEADHYHTPAVDPSWNQGMDQVVQIEDHIFFVDPQPKG